MRDKLQLPRQPREHGTSVLVLCGLAFEAAIAAGPDVIAFCGLGAGSHTADLEAWLAQHGHACGGIISFGTAGGLDPALQPGDCVLAERVVTPDRAFAADACWLGVLRACLPGARQGALVGVDHPVLDAAAKAHLWRSSGGCAVDMESHRAAWLAQRYGLPFAACRVIVDHAYRHVPTAAVLGVHADGTIVLSRLLRELLRHPAQLPGCVRLAFDAAAARCTLRAVRLQTGQAFALPMHADRHAASGPAVRGL